MPQSATVNRRIALNARPARATTASHFRMDDGAVPVAIADVKVSGTVSRVDVFRHGDLTVGDPARGHLGWHDGTTMRCRMAKASEPVARGSMQCRRC